MIAVRSSAGDKDTILEGWTRTMLGVLLNLLCNAIEYGVDAAWQYYRTVAKINLTFFALAAPIPSLQGHVL